jgi:ABC-2 type transport system ATP-binding protein
MAVASFESLSKNYGRHRAVDGVSFEVQDREVIGLLGPNGSGKTTILRILSGYLRPSGGSVRVDGFDVVSDGHAARARVGYVPENAPLYDHMRVNEFLAFMGRLRGLYGPALSRRLDAARAQLALGAVGEVLIGRLSRGYRQRVAIAQAVLHEPRLLVLDEPTNGLDPRQIIELRGFIATLSRTCAVLVSSHILLEMERTADRVAILLDGRLLTVHALDRSAPGVVLKVRARADSAAAIAAMLAATPGVTEVSPEEPCGEVAAWRVRATNPRVAEKIATGLCSAGIGSVQRLEAGSDLEELFLRLTASKAAH